MRERSGSRTTLLLNLLDPDCSVQKQIKCKILILNGIEPKFTQLGAFWKGCVLGKEGRVRECSVGGESWKKGEWASLINQVGYSKSPCYRVSGTPITEWVQMPVVYTILLL